MRIRLVAVDAGAEELAAIERVFASGVLTDGPETAAFEREFAARHQVEHAVALSSGTTALQAMLPASGIGPGDEVVVPSLTFVSTATAVLHVGATPVADEAGVLLFEDAAEAHGASYCGRPVGGLGRAAMFSFTPTKNMTTGEGGMVTTDDGDLAQRLRLLRNHGQTGRMEHTTLGFNWRMTEVQAAMGRVQPAKLDAVLARKASRAASLAGRWPAACGRRWCAPTAPTGTCSTRCCSTGAATRRRRHLRRTTSRLASTSHPRTDSQCRPPSRRATCR